MSGLKCLGNEDSEYRCKQEMGLLNFRILSYVAENKCISIAVKKIKSCINACWILMRRIGNLEYKIKYILYPV